MIELDVEQGSPEWVAARLGIPTASQFHRLITPKTRKASSQSAGYRNELLAEWLFGLPADAAKSGYMDRGGELEADAAAWYEMRNDCDTRKLGFALRDDRRVGCSPDRMVGDRGGLEIKCRSAPIHIGYLLGDADEAYCQVQGCMWVCEREWWDFLAYHPLMPAYSARIERDDAFIAQLEIAVNLFLEGMDEMKDKLLRLGCEPRPPQITIDAGMESDASSFATEGHVDAA